MSALSHMYVLVDRRPVPAQSIEQWGAFLGTDRRVARTVLRDGSVVSTVFLGVDYRFDGNKGPPILFETMTFKPDGGTYDFGHERYASWDDAETGHAVIVRRATEFLKTEVDVSSRTA